MRATGRRRLVLGFLCHTASCDSEARYSKSLRRLSTDTCLAATVEPSHVIDFASLGRPTTLCVIPPTSSVLYLRTAANNREGTATR